MKQAHFTRLVVKFHDFLNIPYTNANEINDFLLQGHIIPWRDLLQYFPGISINKLFISLGAARITQLVARAKKTDSDYQPADLLSYYVITCPQKNNPGRLLKMLLQTDKVELAYIEYAPASAPSGNIYNDPLHHYQGYLNPSPEGINARYTLGIKGGNGKGDVKFIDIEQGWLLDHEDIMVNTLDCTGINCNSFKDHGAAVLGIIMMRNNAVGGIGIVPGADGYVISQWRPGGILNMADAIMAAISHLRFGDIILLESQTFASTTSRRAWPVEIQEATFDVIRLATALGITVIEAGGNGNSDQTRGNDLDLFTDRQGKKILDRLSPDFRDSGAIIVAAASSTLPHTKINYSNYGNRVDCYAWGENVVTAGYHPGNSGLAINTYTGNFGGTSAASAIIAGAAIAVQSITAANHQSKISPKDLRQLLGNDLYGTPSVNGRLADKIGVMPDLKKITEYILKPGTSSAIIDPKHSGRNKKRFEVNLVND